MYRLHLDVSYGHDQDDAILKASQLLELLAAFLKEHNVVDVVKYRLGNDDDRQRSNYLDINENGHVSNHKLTLETNVNERTA